MSLVDVVESKFREHFKEQPLLVRSPGRVNLIGEHTDYNDGYVLPAAIDMAIYFGIAPSKDEQCRVVALDMNDEHGFNVGQIHPTPKGWPNYLMGVVDQFNKENHKIGGFNCVFGGDIPIGAGLSSSAALEAGLAFALNTLFEIGLDDLTLVKLAQRSENDFVGVRCGIMDQFVNIFGEQDKVLRIDCRSLEYETYPFDFSVAIVLFDTRVARWLASSEYNRRREECNEGVALLKKRYPSATHLRDISLEMLTEFKQVMNAATYRRCEYVVEENDRLLKACHALEMRDLKAFGQHMYQTHDGLSHKYEVSCKELDYLVELVRGYPEVYGARMMGGGFGGCTINLVKLDAVQGVVTMVREQYGKKFGVELNTYVTSIGSGTSVIEAHEPART